MEPTSQLEAVFASIPNGVIVYDLEGKILRMNPAALTLFEIASENLYRRKSYRQFVRRYQIRDENQQPISLKHWEINRVIRGDTALGAQEDTVMVHLPSGRSIYVIISCAPVFDSQRHQMGTVCVFHNITDRYQHELQVRRTSTSLLALIQAIADIPTLIDRWSPEATLLLPPAMSFVGQQLVELIGQMLACARVFLLSLGPPRDHLYYVAMWGLTPEQEQRRRENNGRFALSDFLDEATLAQLSANKEVRIPHDRVRLPFLDRDDLGPLTTLWMPIVLGKQLAGMLVIARDDLQDEYTPEEIALVRAIAMLIALVIECVQLLNKVDGTSGRAFVLQEANQLINEFLNLASHELRTPLAAMMGNIQLAQRRLEALRKRVEELSKTASREVEQVRQPLEHASESARLQERIIRDMMDDARIQAHTLTLHKKPHDLIKLVRETVAAAQRQAPERKIVLNIKYTGETVPIVADADRIKQVIDIYLSNALNYSPADLPVTVQLTVEGSVARVSVHDEGVGIPPEEQEHVWERFYRAKGITVQHELDLSLGLSLYICQELIKYHDGGVGLQSVPGQGSTFWFTLPVAPHQK
ncbi:hypothetical protein KSF_046460 [Reticulibacter mediterranei]|uniref:histidine kinase n=1 Tax=Reticulibacter mediterranei TaxID=2778369 RepID=A0A8J3N3P8_9CHLR|nr:PAS domain-containing sensor histidine kinase [Reticulibacter mediterranei]GHO94598.1 hypothetical protein KSF_046460 [Reticulibacter mediterranei]